MEQNIEKLYRQFPDVHPYIVLKTDVLRQGVKISERAQQEFNATDDILWRDTLTGDTLPPERELKEIFKTSRGTLRGLHAQSPHPQGKLARVIEGEVWDVVVDARDLLQ